MAEGWAKALQSGVIDAYSAGVDPHGMNQTAVKVMAEAGVDISRQRSKHVDELKDIAFDYVVTVCDHAHESCPLFPGKTKIVHVGFDDPPRLAKVAASEDEALGHYRRVRDEIRTFIQVIHARLAPGAGSAPMPIRKYIAEMIGTFALVFAGTGAIVINDVSRGAITHVGIALTFGLVVMSMIYAVGDISGAHLNPAVTIGFWLARRLERHRVIPYIASQLIGAFAASGVLRLMFIDHATLGATIPYGSPSRSFMLEAILTAILMFVILSVSSGPKEKGLMAGIAIGGVIAFEAMFAGPICGASMNPARSLAPAIMSGQVHDIWLYIAGPMLGAASCAPWHRWMMSRATDCSDARTTHGDR